MILNKDTPVFVLCGGRASRLEGLVPEDQAKIMTDINGTPFVNIFIDHYKAMGLENFLFIAGHNSDSIHLPTYYPVITEETPRGTLGALELAACHIIEPVVVLNGDTIVDTDKAAINNLMEVLEDSEFTDEAKIVTLCSRMGKTVDGVLTFGRLNSTGISVVSPKLMPDIPSYFRDYDAPLNIEDLLWLDNPGDVDVEDTCNYWDIGTEEGLKEYREYHKESVLGECTVRQCIECSEWLTFGDKVSGGDICKACRESV
jgi:molybdopterin-guanine dinucleotide biosynthesis protein A